jgi:UDP-3-O-[3-hydroxymyristoyl] glucosamine N-acyltransferase
LFYRDNVVIGDNVTIFAGTKIYEQTIIGNNCIFWLSYRADGFGFAQILMGL